MVFAGSSSWLVGAKGAEQASVWTVSTICPTGPAGAAFVCGCEVGVVEQKVACSSSPPTVVIVRTFN
jgi:hypothetical protein